MPKFEIQIDQAVLDDLGERLARTRFPDELDGVGWDYGTELAYARELVAYWRDKYDWRTHEAALNRFDHFKTEIAGVGDQAPLDVHYIHQRSPHEDALPLVITHGWPGSVYEFYKILGPLTDPTAHGGKAADAFHVVCPSMPGYGFSSAPNKPGFDIKCVGETVVKLMAKLGYDAYVAQGGDWGAMATTWIGLLDPEHVRAIHLNMVVGTPPEGVANPMEGLTPEELKDLADTNAFMSDGAGYQQIQGTRPQTLGYGLNDSPAGLAMWITEKFRAWSDCHGDIESRFSKDDLLTNTMLYWATGAITSSTRLYCESMRSNRFGLADGKVEVPTGAAIFPGEIVKMPRTWAEQRFNIQRWTRFESGGHFAALEEPEALVGDLREFFRDYRG